MSLDLTPLDPASLSTAAQRALGAGPGRMMASKGMLPLPPADQVAVLYQLALDADTILASTARATANGLPEKLLVGTLADPALDSRVLHFFGEMFADKPAVFDAIVLNPAASDPTIAVLAAKGGAREVDQIAQNEQRLLRHPEIIAAMYMNRKARMSTIDRVVELAVRNNVRVPGIACWEEVARALTGGSADDDATFEEMVDVVSGDDSALTAGDANQALPEHDGKEEEQKLFRDQSIPVKIRLVTLGNAQARADGIRDPIKLVAVAAIKSPGVTDMEAARYANNPSLAEEVIRYIAMKREWTKLYGVKVSLCRNPKTPIPEAMKLLPFLREKDLANIGKSRGVPSAVDAGKEADHAAQGRQQVDASLLARLGLAIIQPRVALALAADRKHAGRSGTDLILCMVLVLLATQLRGLAAAVWLGAVAQVGLGVRAGISVLTGALTVELGFLVIAAIVLFVAGGPRRNAGRAFDLACVAALPLLYVTLAATVVVRLVDADPPRVVSMLLAGVSYAWAGGLAALAIAQNRAPATPSPRASRAGLAIVGLALVGTIVQVTWIARHADTMRPMSDGDPAPTFTLREIAAGGQVGAPVALADRRGKIVIVDFWATWCGPCLAAMPKLETLARRYAGQLEIIAINLDDPTKARALWDDRGYRMTLLADDGDVSTHYGVQTIPHTVLIDRAGVVQLVARGSSSAIERAVQAQLAK